MTSRKLRFDGWVLDPESGDLERDGTRIRLQEQPVQVLRELIAHAGSVVSREQLIALLWPKGVVDFDTGLNTVIRKLRSALGDTSETPRYIETLPRRGYRFIGTPDGEPDAASAASLAMPVSPTPAELGVPVPGTKASAPAARGEATSANAPAIAPTRRRGRRTLAAIAVLAVAGLLTGVYALWRERSGASVSGIRVEAPSQSGRAAHTAASFAPPPHSIAVLPLVNLSGDKDQEYFSDGLTEELINSLTHIDGLQVAARTSSFSFRERPDIADVARKLNVATVLEGSVRRSGHTMRITVQLNNAVTGFNVWSQTYDRDLSDVLKLQTEIATAVATALEVTLLGDVRAKIELGGTRNPAAFDSYLRASRAYSFAHGAQDVESAIAAYTEAIRLDPGYALALAGRSIALTLHASTYAKGATIREDDQTALADARRAIALAPELAQSHLALYLFLQERTLDFAQASAELERAVTIAPGNAWVLAMYGRFAAFMGHSDAGVAAARHAVVLDPLDPLSHYRLAQALYFAHRFAESVAAWTDVLAIDPQEPESPGARGLAYYGIGDFQNARASCEARPDNETTQWCLALTYDRLARHADAERALAKLRAAPGSRWAYRCATIYAQRGDTVRAIKWLDKALQARLPELRWLKTDPLMDPLRKTPRFQAIERELNFPD